VTCDAFYTPSGAGPVCNVHTYANTDTCELLDSDGDGITDFDEVNVYGTNPNDIDSDGDTITDFDEIIVLGTDPNAIDTDRDGTFDVADNCPRTYNPDQADTGGVGVATPDDVGDACQNGDFNRDGIFDLLDITLERRSIIGLDPPLDPAMPPNGP
jgi:hypothetical protein